MYKKRTLSDCVPADLIAKFEAKQDAYVLNSAISIESKTKLALGLSNCTLQVYRDTYPLSTHAHNSDVTNVKFSQENPSLLFSSSLDGTLNVWDLRMSKAVQTFIENSDGIKPLTCFDFNLEEQLVCAGTELIREDSFLLFWDRRSTKILGGYWNSHTDDITQVHFHPTITSCMASSSVDGLLNVFDLNLGTEDDALSHTLNIGAGVAKFHWKKFQQLSCMTSLEEFQLWSQTEASPTYAVFRDALTEKYQIDVDYFIDSCIIGGLIFVATGTYEGFVHLWQAKDNGCLLPYSFLIKGHKGVVRTMCYDSQADLIITGGEDGSVCQWKIPWNKLAVCKK